jgi:3-hydroxymyristoyl/3-hydroxydecanoyl-(acyl carrier protein) dehydratase
VTRQKLDLQIPAVHPCFDGHFPGNPLVPGALLLQWIQALVEEQFPGRQIAEVRSMKFLAPVLPGTHLGVEIDPKQNGDLRVRAFSGTDVICEGSFTLDITSRPR